MTDEQRKRDDKAFVNFWFYAGGGIYGAFKQRKWSVLRDLAHELPKTAWHKALAHCRETEVKELKEEMYAELTGQEHRLGTQIEIKDIKISALQEKVAALEDRAKYADQVIAELKEQLRVAVDALKSAGVDLWDDKPVTARRGIEEALQKIKTMKGGVG